MVLTLVAVRELAVMADATRTYGAPGALAEDLAVLVDRREVVTKVCTKPGRLNLAIRSDADPNVR